MDGKGRQDFSERVIPSVLFHSIECSEFMARAYDVVHADVIVVVYIGWQRVTRCCGETYKRRRWIVPMKTQEASDIELDSDLHDYLPLSARSEHDYEGF